VDQQVAASSNNAASVDAQAASSASAPENDEQAASAPENDEQAASAPENDEQAASAPENDEQAQSAEDLSPEPPAMSADDPLLFETAAPAADAEDARLKAVMEAIIYVTDEPLALDQISSALEQPRERVARLLEQLTAEYEQPERGLSIREVAGGYKLSTKPEHHDAVRRFVKNLKPPLKLSLPALETLAVIAYKQPITAPEIMEIRGVQGAGVLKTLLDRKVIATAGRKNVVGKPILYKTTREFLVQFGLKDLSELPTLKEFQEIGRLDTETPDAQKGTTATSAGPESPDNQPPENEPPDSPPPQQEPPQAKPSEEDPPAEPDAPASEQVE
jgi:segregation and condensation protein B